MMPFKRHLSPPRHSESSSRSSSSSSTEPPLKRLRSHSPQTFTPIPTIKVYIVQAKLDVHTISDLFSVTESHRSQWKGKGKDRQLSLELCQVVNDAEIIITAIRMRKRLERHVDWEVAVSNTNVTDDTRSDLIWLLIRNKRLSLHRNGS
jgi:DNA polymerase IV